MRPIITPEQMRELDCKTIEDLGLPGIVLMELAARGVMLEIEGALRGRVHGARALVFCGGGNNGGDGFAVARRLLNAGALPIVMLLAERNRITGDAKINLEVYEKLGGEVVDVKTDKELQALPHADIIVDALLGTGIKGGAKGIIAEAINAINSHGAIVVSVDIPSGIDGSTGYANGPAVEADITATFGEIKIGHVINPGFGLAGRISRVDIQIPYHFIEDIDVPLYLVEAADVYEMLPQRANDAHKGDSGKVLVVAGSVGMTGAADLAARACLRTGAGLVKVATARNAQAILAGKTSEVMTIPVEDTENGTIAPEAETSIDEAREWADVEVIGPGITVNPKTLEWFTEHVQDLPMPTVIDGDGLTALAEALKSSKPDLGEHIVLTPHPGEFARLTGKPTEESAQDRVSAARDFARTHKVTLLLKGVPTLVAGPDGPVYAVITGNPGMATAGMGDVLTGVIAGLLAQGLGPREAAIAGATIHGLAGDLAAREVGTTGLVSGDVVEKLPLAHDICAGRAGFPGSSHGGCGCGGGGCGCGGHDEDDECGCDDGSCGCGGH